MHILIQNGTIVNTEGSLFADVLVRDGFILQIGKGFSPDIVIDKTIDAEGCFILPGGVDPHVHLHLQTASGFTSDDFKSGTKAALYGGTTSIIDFVTPQRGQSLYEAFHLRKADAKKSMIDYKLHVSPVEWLKTTEDEIKQCFFEDGVRSFKIYMAYKNSIGINDGTILQVMKTVGRLGGIVTAHCEMGNEIERLRDDFTNSGKVSVKYHALSRPAELEALAIKRAIDISNKADCPLYIVHVSAKASLEAIRKAQSKMQTVYAETCPQYLVLNDEKYQSEFETSAPYVMSPPLRKNEDNQALWHAIADNTIQSVGTDHCSFTLDQKKMGLNDFRNIPNGAGSIEHRLELLYTYGYLQNKINLNRLVEIFSTQPAKIFRIFPQKGTISVGSDADIVIWDPKPERTISAESHHQNCDSNIYEGVNVRGQARHVFIRGRHVIENAEMVHQPKGFYIL